MKLWHSELAGGLTDQTMVSLGNFALNILLARSFGERDYGAFALILSFVLFLNTLHQAFVIFPLSLQGASANPARMPFFVAVAATLTFIEMALFFPVIGAVIWSVGQLNLLLPACAFLLAWQLQEVWRRGFIARARYGAAILVDFVRYILPLGAIAVLGNFRFLSLGTTFTLLTAFALAAALPLAPRSIVLIGSLRGRLAEELRMHWATAAPVLGANILAALSNQWFLWLLAWSHDLSSTAVLMALANIVAFSNPVIVGMENILVPEIARRRESLSFSGLLNLLRRRGLAAFLLITPPLLAVMVWPAMVLHLFYGAHRTYAQFTLPLQMLAGASAATLASFILSATLRGYRATGAVFRMQLYPALFGALLGSWLTLRFGVGGACLATLLAALLRAGIGAWYVARLRQAIAPAPESEAPMFRSADARQGA